MHVKIWGNAFRLREVQRRCGRKGLGRLTGTGAASVLGEDQALSEASPGRNVSSNSGHNEQGLGTSRWKSRLPALGFLPSDLSLPCSCPQGNQKRLGSWLDCPGVTEAFPPHLGKLMHSVGLTHRRTAHDLSGADNGEGWCSHSWSGRLG